MQLGEFFPAFFGRFSRIEILDEHLSFTPALGFRGIESLRLRLGD
jgi:hypothetical protein